MSLKIKENNNCFCVYRNNPYHGFRTIKGLRNEYYKCIKCCFKRQDMKKDVVLRAELAKLLQQVNVNINVDMKEAQKNLDKFNLLLQSKRKTINEMDYELILEYMQIKERFDDQRKKMNSFLVDFEEDYIRQIGMHGEPQLPFSMPENIIANPEITTDLLNDSDSYYPCNMDDFINFDFNV